MGLWFAQGIITVTALDDGCTGYVNLAAVQQSSLLQHAKGAGVEGVTVDLHVGVIFGRLPAASRFVKNRCGRGAGGGGIGGFRGR